MSDFKPKKFKQYITEAKTAGDDLEYALKDTWVAQQPVGYGIVKAPAMQPILDVLLKELGKPSSEAGAEQMGRGSFPVSPIWDGNNGTPKTDVALKKDGEIYRLSVKMGDARLMSGRVDETIATFKAAAANSSIYNDQELTRIYVELLDDVKNSFNTGRTKGVGVEMVPVGQVWKYVGKGKGSHAKKVIVKAPVKSGTVEAELAYHGPDENKDLQLHNRLKEEATKKVTEFFNQNEKFRMEFVREALSGAIKFGGLGATPHTDKLPIAEYVFSSNKDGSMAALHEIEDNFVKAVDKASAISFGFKSTQVMKVTKKVSVGTGLYEYSTTCQIGTQIKKLTAALQAQAKNEGIEEEFDMLTEGIFDKLGEFAKGLWNKIKSLYEQFTSYVDKAIKWMKESFDNVLHFFGMEIDNRHLNPTVNWASL
jgi:hypothetical protein